RMLESRGVEAVVGIAVLSIGCNLSADAIKAGVMRAVAKFRRDVTDSASGRSRRLIAAPPHLALGPGVKSGNATFVSGLTPPVGVGPARCSFIRGDATGGAARASLRCGRDRRWSG
ncbi:MAG TPA: hypothetical protein VHV78_09580, partial [Gemmatimonadaceae bacterium]|nr:hypothetical protein [Gemmatimonadaceae bacterium]